MAFERAIESATARADVEFVADALAEDFAFTHGDAWRTGGTPSVVDTKTSLLNSVARGLFVSREVNAQHVEPHGSIFITTGRIDVKLKPPLLLGASRRSTGTRPGAWSPRAITTP